MSDYDILRCFAYSGINECPLVARPGTGGEAGNILYDHARGTGLRVRFKDMTEPNREAEMRRPCATNFRSVPVERFPGSRTTLGAWVKTICRALDGAGCDSAGLLADVGVDIRSLDGPAVRCPLTLSFYLWECAATATGDPAFGIKAASYIKNASFQALSYSICASATLKEAFERSQRYSRVVSDAVEYEFSRHGDEYRFIIEPTTHVPDESVDCLVGAYLRMCRSLVGRDFSASRIDLRRPAPCRSEDFHALLRAPLRFEAPRTQLVFDAESMERPLADGNPELARHNDRIVLQYLSRIERQNIQARVRDVLTQRLSHGEPSQAQVAGA